MTEPNQNSGAADPEAWYSARKAESAEALSSVGARPMSPSRAFRRSTTPL